MDNNIKIVKGGGVDELPDNFGYRINTKVKTLVIPKGLPKPTSTAVMFDSCRSLSDLDLTNLDCSLVTDMSQMFKDCESLGYGNFSFPSNFNSSKVTDMSGMFYQCIFLTTLDLTNLNTSSVTNMSSMFYRCNRLTSLTYGPNFDTSKVTNMSDMFAGIGLPTIDLSQFNTSSLTNMYEMFSSSHLTSLTIPTNFNTSKVTHMGSLFLYASNLTALDLANIDTSSVTQMFSMFEGCSSLTELDLTSFNFDKVTSFSNMLDMGGTCTVYVKSEADKTLLTNNANPSSGVTIVVKS